MCIEPIKALVQTTKLSRHKQTECLNRGMDGVYHHTNYLGILGAKQPHIQTGRQISDDYIRSVDNRHSAQTPTDPGRQSHRFSRQSENRQTVRQIVQTGSLDILIESIVSQMPNKKSRQAGKLPRQLHTQAFGMTMQTRGQTIQTVRQTFYQCSHSYGFVRTSTDFIKKSIFVQIFSKIRIFALLYGFF